MITKLTLLLWLLPILYKFFFWLYTIQLKEYRWDRYKEYLFTLQWKQAIFNKLNYLEVLFLILAFVNLIIFNNQNIILNFLTIIFLFLYSLFFIYKLIKKKLLKPKNTSRILIIYILFFIWGFIDLYYLNTDFYSKYSIVYIFLVLIFMPLILFFYNLISLPIVNYKKNKIIKNAIKKSKEIDRPIKIAITWSYWKSSVKEFLSSILKQDWSLLKTPENINTELWVSSIVLNKLNNSYKYFVAEIWAYRIWEISLLWKIVNHKYWFLTAIWNQHIWLFWNQQNIIKWKFEILEKVKENNWFFYVNSDNKLIENYLEKINTTNIIRYWLKSEKACAKSKIIEINDLKTKFEFNYNWITEVFETNLIWEHNILNITWILAFCYDIWFKTEDLKNYLLNIEKPKNTQEILKVWDNILIDDTYNLSEAWLKSGLNLLKYFNNKEKILVLDDILELWLNANEIHYNLAKEIAEKKLADKVLFVWVNYTESFKKGLLDWWFNNNQILKIMPEKISESVILFEGKKAKVYLDKLKNNGIQDL